MKVYDVLIQCGLCNGEIEHTILYTEPEMGQETSHGVCHKCNQDDEVGVFTVVDENQVYRDPEEIREWYESRKPISSYVIREDYLNDDLEVVCMTAWAVPKSEYPFREWLTLKEVAEVVGMGEEGVRTAYKRRKFFAAEIQGLIQRSGATILVHRDAVRMVFGDRDDDE